MRIVMLCGRVVVKVCNNKIAHYREDSVGNGAAHVCILRRFNAESNAISSCQPNGGDISAILAENTFVIKMFTN